jgi:hypothetical protein
MGFTVYDTLDEAAPRDPDSTGEGDDKGLGGVAEGAGAGAAPEKAKLDAIKRQWLEQQALKNIDNIVDCDIGDRTVKVLINGEVFTRRITERFTRVMGYHRPVSAFNPGKQSEHKERVLFSEPKAI